MPIVRYFIVVGPLLLGLILLADAQLPPPGPLANSTNFYGLQSTVAVRPAAPRLTVVSAPAPDMNSPAVLAAAPEPIVTASTQATKPAPAAKPEPPQTKRKRVARKPNWHDNYAQAWRSSPPTRLW